MLAYFIKRICYMVPILVGVNLLVFAMFFVVNTPDDMARMALGEKADRPEAIAQWKANRGYDVPLLYNAEVKGIAKVTKTIFWRKSLALFWGDFGYSDASGRSIGEEIRARVWPSFALALPIFLGTLIANIILGMKLASCRGSATDWTGQFICVALMSNSILILIIFGQ
ncbi:MAG: hypothetical protein MJ106_03265 [Lentisphaeria bacterium]|nr:hypothetical protein [Lentisphaeria bacterium]